MKLEFTKSDVLRFSCFSCIVVGIISVAVAVLLLLGDQDNGIIPVLQTSTTGETDHSSTQYQETQVTPGDTQNGDQTEMTTKIPTDLNSANETTKPPSNIKTIKAEVKTVNGIPRLFINNKMEMPVMFFGNTDRNDRYEITSHQVKLAAANGIHFHSFITNLNYTKSKIQKLIYQDFSSDCDAILSGDPNGKLMVRVNVGQFNTQGVKESELMKFVGGEEKTSLKLVSIASDEWFEDCKVRLANLVKYARTNPDYSDHVFGWHLECGEWFQYGFREAGVDISPANDRKFREYLKNKYKTDANLKKAWGNQYTLASAKVPRDFPNNLSSARYSPTLLLRSSDTRYIDYMDYYNQLVSSRINELAKVIKEASNYENIVISFYGYLFELCDAQSGHYDMRTLLNSKYIDGFASPVSYGDRTGGLESGGATSAYMTAVASVVRSGKLWFSESDQRTYINRTEQQNDRFCTIIKDIPSIQDVHKREIGHCMVNGTGMYAMDLMPIGWLDDSRIWKNIGKLEDLFMSYSKSQKAHPKYDVALVVDEKAQCLVGDPVDLSFKTLSQARFNLYRAGVKFSTIEIDDVINGRANDFKVYIFANPYRLSTNAVNKLIAQLHKDNKVSVFMYGFGATFAADVKKLTGFNIKTEDSIESLKLNISQSEIAGLNGITNNYAFQPRTVITGGQSVTLGKYDNGSVGMAIYKGGNYKTIFCGLPNLTSEQIRAIAKYAGVNVYLDTNDVFTANENLIVFNTTRSGNKTIKFAVKTDVYDYFENKWYIGVTSVTFDNMPAERCKFLFYGNKSSIEKIKLPKWQ